MSAWSDALGRADSIASLTAPLRLELSAAVPSRLNVLIPQIEFEHFFGGFIAIVNLARRLAQAGVPTRLVVLGGEPADPDSRSALSSYAGPLFLGDEDGLEIEFAHDRRLCIGAGDRFVATIWLLAYVAHAASVQLGAKRFCYLIQEYDRLVCAADSWGAAAAGAYRLPHGAVFSTELLRCYFRARGLGVFRDDGPGDDEAAVFNNAITDVPAPAAEKLRERARRGCRRILVYARPEVHAGRNLLELVVIALRELASHGELDGWRLTAAGAAEPSPDIDLGGGVSMEVIPRAHQPAWAQTLAGHDVGIALQYTAHPGLVPVEMAAAGAVTVTSTYETKDAASIRAISDNLIPVPPSPAAIVGGVRAALARSADYERRARAAAELDWPRDWATAFDEHVLARVVEFAEFRPR